MQQAHVQSHPARWKVVVAFTTVYLTWGTTYLAIREGVQFFPPALFGGVRLFCAGLVLFLILAVRRHNLRIPLRELVSNSIVGILMFVGGNGLMTFGEVTVPSGLASLLAATSPMWMAVLELSLPRGSRLRPIGWAGLVLGLCGVLVLLTPGLEASSSLFADTGPLLLMGSSICWSAGSVLARYQPRSASHLTTGSWQLMFGGAIMTIYGLWRGEPALLTADCFTPVAVYSFFHLLVFGSLLGFMSYHWLLGHVSAASAGTYAYVNPLIAVMAGWLFAGESLTAALGLGMIIILSGVALVRIGAKACRRPALPITDVPRQTAPVTEELRSLAIERAADSS